MMTALWMSNLPAVKKAWNSKVKEAVSETVTQIQRDAKKNATGAAISLEDRSKLKAAFAGRGPKVDTGTLRRSIAAIFPVGIKAIGAVVARAPYAAHVEFGTKRSRAFPFLQAAVEANREGHIKRVKSATGAK